MIETPNGVPMIGQQQQVASQLFLSMYVPLIPQLAVYRAAHGYEGEPGCPGEAATPERVAAEAESFVWAAMGRLGFKRA